LGAPTFVVVFLTYEHVHARFELLQLLQRSRCFLDKLCIRALAPHGI
jgi:hypothetical protein